MGFGVHLIINLLSPDRLRDFLFYEKLASPGYLGFADNLIINLLPHDRLRSFFLIEDETPLKMSNCNTSWDSSWISTRYPSRNSSRTSFFGQPPSGLLTEYPAGSPGKSGIPVSSIENILVNI